VLNAIVIYIESCQTLFELFCKALSTFTSHQVLLVIKSACQTVAWAAQAKHLNGGGEAGRGYQGVLKESFPFLCVYAVS